MFLETRGPQIFQCVIIAFPTSLQSDFSFKNNEFDYSPHHINALEKRHCGISINSRRVIAFLDSVGMGVLMFSLRGESGNRPKFFFIPAPLCRFPAPIVVASNSHLNSKVIKQTVCGTLIYSNNSAMQPLAHCMI